MGDDRVKLTKTSVAAIAPDPAKQRLVWDAEIRGFGVRVSPGGAKAYIMQRRVGAITRRVTIGRADDMSAEKARKAAEKLAAQFAEGVDPVREKRLSEARAMTLEAAFESYIKAPKQKGAGRGGPKKPLTIDDIRQTVQSCFKDWLEKPVVEITGQMVKDRHAEIAERSEARANAAMRYLRAAINHVNADSDDDEPIIARNPVDRLNRANQWAPQRRAEGHIPAERLADWIEAVQTGVAALKYGPEMRDAMVFLLLTGARVAEALGNPRKGVGYPALRWRDVDLEARTVTFRDTKNGSAHVQPLPRALADLLAQRKAVAGPEFVFSNRDGVSPLTIDAGVDRVEKMIGLRATAHDLRRTFASVASTVGVGGYTLKALLNHVSGGDVTAGYVRTSLDDKRAAIEAIADFMLSPDRRPRSNVVTLGAA